MKKVFVALVALALVSPVLAQERPQDDPPGGPPPGIQAAHHQVVRFLDLTEDQIGSWDAIYLLHRDAEQLIRDDMLAVEEALRVLLEDDEPDPEAVGELVLERHALGQEMAGVHQVYHDDFMALLDEQQQDRLGFIARADQVQPIIPAFKLFELIPRR